MTKKKSEEVKLRYESHEKYKIYTFKKMPKLTKDLQFYNRSTKSSFFFQCFDKKSREILAAANGIGIIKIEGLSPYYFTYTKNGNIHIGCQTIPMLAAFKLLAKQLGYELQG